MKVTYPSWVNRLLSLNTEDADHSLLHNLIRRTDTLAYLFMIVLSLLTLFTKPIAVGGIAILVTTLAFEGVIVLNRWNYYDISRPLLILAVYGYLTFDYCYDDTPNYVIFRIIVPAWIGLIVYESKELYKVIVLFVIGCIMLTYAMIQLHPNFHFNLEITEKSNFLLLFTFTSLFFLFSKELENNYYRKVRLKEVQIQTESLYHQTYLKMRANQKKFLALFNASGDALFVFNQDQFIITDANQKAVELFQVSHKDELIGKAIHELFSEKISIAPETFNSNDSWQETLQCQTLNGSFGFWSEVHVQMIDTEAGQAGLLQIHDIDEQRHTYEKLKNTLQQLRDTQQFGQIGTWRKDIVKDENFLSEEAYELMNFPVNTQADISMLRNVMLPDEFERLEHEIQAGIESKADFHFVFTIHLEGAIERTLLSRCHPILNDEGEVTELFGATMNISGLKRMQTIAEANEKRFRMLFETAPLAMWTTTMSGQVRVFNPSMIALFGLDEPETAKLRIGHLIHPDDQRLYRMNRDLLFQMDDAKSLQFEIRLVHQSGAIVWGKMSLTLMQDAESDTPYYVHMVADITMDKHREAELQKAKLVAEEANRVKTDFLAHLSHDLRNPLNGILGALELLDEKLSDDELKHYTRMIRLSGKKLTQNIGNILDYSRNEAGKTYISNDSFNLKNLCHETGLLYTELAQEKGLSFKNQCEQIIYEYVIGDRYLVSRIMDNLIGNALKFTEKGGIICRIDQEAGLRANIIQTVFTIQDTGIGIKPDDLDKLFIPFSQLDSSTTKLYQGTGLGLAISRELARKMGGDITVSSEYGIGTTFRVSIPFPKAAAPDSMNQDTIFLTDASFDPTKYHILIAEDDESNAEYLITLLRNYGYHTDLVYNGQQLLKVIQHKSYHLLLLDGAMPFVDGYQAAAQIRKKENSSSRHRMTIIGVTGYALSHDRDKFLLAGADDYLTKPIDQNTLLMKIQDHLRSKS